MSRSGGAVLSTDRRFAPVYAAIRDYDYRHALTLCERRELATSPLGKALKALVLCRGGSQDEALALATTLARERPTDLHVLRALAAVFKQTGDMGWFVQLFDSASEQRPTDVPLLRQLCFAFAHVEDYGKMQKTALRLMKLTGDQQYAAWAAVAVHAAVSLPAETSLAAAPNAVTGGGRGWGWAAPAAGDRSLVVAQAMLARALDVMPRGARDGEVLGLWSLALVRQGLAADALAAVAGPDGRYSDTLADAVVPPAPAAPDDSVADDGIASGDAALLELPFDEEVREFADGSGGRGSSPGPLQTADHAALVAFLATEAALATERRVGASSDARSAWCRAREAYTKLLLLQCGGASGGDGASADSRSRTDWATVTGIAYCAARVLAVDAEIVAAGGADAASSLGHIVAWAAPVRLEEAAASSFGFLTGVPEVDATLRGCSDKVVCDRRSAALARVLFSALRVELAQRILSSTPEVVALSPLSSDALSTAADVAPYVAAVAACVVSSAHKAGAFSDLKPFLTPLIQVAPADPMSIDARDATSSSVGTGTSCCRLTTGFLAPDARILAMPWAPIAAPGSASDVAPSTPLFRWSFVAAPDTSTSRTSSGNLLAVLEDMRERYRPTAADAAAWRNLTAAARDAASARDNASRGALTASAEAVASARDGNSIEDDDEVVILASKKGAGGKSKNKGNKTKGAAKSSTAAAGRRDAEVASAEGAAVAQTTSKDPHGVAAVLDPPRLVLLTDEQQVLVTAARDSVRRYSTAMQLLRYLGCVSAQSAYIETVSPGVSTMRAVVDELVSAWSYTLDLSPLCCADPRETLEGDELPLLAAHMLAELGFSEIAAALAEEEVASREQADSAMPPAPSLSPPGIARREAAWRYFVEVSAVLYMASAVSPGNGQLELACTRAQAWLGNTSGVFERWRRARVRHIMLDSLGYLLVHPVARSGWLQTLTGSGREVADFHRQSAMVSPDYTVCALRGGHFGAALDVMRLRLRLRESATFARARSLSSFIYVVAGGRTLPEAQAHLRRAVLTGEVPDAWVDVAPGALARLRDNDDRDVFQCWDPPSPVALEELRGRSPAATRLDAVARALAGAGSVCAVLEAAMGLRAATSTSTWAHIASRMAGGPTGGSAERAVRRALLQASLCARHATLSALLHAGDGAVSALDASLSRLRLILAGAGLVECGSSSSVCGATAGHYHTVCGELVSGALNGPDTGATTLSDSFARGCSGALMCALEAMRDCIVAAGGGPAAAAAATSGASRLRQITRSVSSLCSSVEDSARRAAPAVAATKIDRGSIAPAQVVSWRPHVLMALPAEAALLVSHTMPFVALALATAAAALQQSRLKASATAKQGSSAKAKVSTGDEDARTLALPLRRCIDAAIASLTTIRSHLGDVREALTRLGPDGDAALLGSAQSGELPFASSVVAAYVHNAVKASDAAEDSSPVDGASFVAHVARSRSDSLQLWSRWLADRLAGTCRSSFEGVEEQIDVRVSLLRSIRVDA